MAAKKNELENLSFEKALEELEEISNKLEGGKESLEDSISLYERGMALKELCEKKLKEAEGKWMLLRKDKSGNIVEAEINSDSIPDLNTI